MEELIEIKQDAKERLIGDLRMYGIIVAIMLVIFVIGQITNMGDFREIFAESDSTALENWIAIFLAAFAMAYIIASIGVGFKFLYIFLSDKIASEMVVGLIVLFLGEIVGMIILPLRVIVNAVRLISVNNKLKNYE